MIGLSPTVLVVDSGVGGYCRIGGVNGPEAISLPSGSEMRRKSSRTVVGIKLVEKRCAVDCVLVRADVNRAGVEQLGVD